MMKRRLRFAHGHTKKWQSWDWKEVYLILTWSLTIYLNLMPHCFQERSPKWYFIAWYASLRRVMKRTAMTQRQGICVKYQINWGEYLDASKLSLSPLPTLFISKKHVSVNFSSGLANTWNSRGPHLSHSMSTFSNLSISFLASQVPIRRKREIAFIKHLIHITIALGMLPSLSLLHTNLQAVGVFNPHFTEEKYRGSKRLFICVD